MKIIANGKEITINSSQEKALLEIKEFLEDETRLFHCLEGSAGTGKTTITKEAIKDFEGEVCVTAPTHKAKKVISRATGLKAKTIHSLLGLMPNVQLEEFSQKNVIFSKGGSGSMMDYNLVVIDEGSMLNKEIVSLIIKNASDFNCKVLFMGDANQLPPVGEDLSIIFKSDDISKSKLTIVERQSFGNPLINLYNDILTDIEVETCPYKKESNVLENKGYLFSSDPKEITDLIIESFKEDKLNNKIICWTNDKVSKWNNLVRKSLTDHHKDPVIVGEIIMSYRQVDEPFPLKGNISENSCEYEILSVLPKVEKQRFEKESYDIYGYKCKILNLDTNNESTVFIVDKQSYNIFESIEKKLSKIAKESKQGKEKAQAWAIFYSFRNKYFLLGNIMDCFGKISVAKDFDYAYAITAHKSQGSTYKNVFIDEPDMDANKKSAERNRLKYVALSRPTDMAFIYFKKE